MSGSVFKLLPSPTLGLLTSPLLLTLIWGMGVGDWGGSAGTLLARGTLASHATHSQDGFLLWVRAKDEKMEERHCKHLWSKTKSWPGCVKTVYSKSFVIMYFRKRTVLVQQAISSKGTGTDYGST